MERVLESQQIAALMILTSGEGGSNTRSRLVALVQPLRDKRTLIVQQIRMRAVINNHR